MSIIETAQKAVIGTVARLLPDAPVDPLIRQKHGSLGGSTTRRDGPRKVGGQARFAAEVALDNLTYAALAYAGIARGTMTRLHTAAAEAAPGVVLVLTHHNAPTLAPPAVFLSDPRAAGNSSLPIMQDASIHWNGEPIALVLAETQEQAAHAASLIAVEYEQEPARLDFAEALTRSRTPSSVLGEPATITVGDAEAALAGAAFKVDNTFHTPHHSHAAIEPHACTVAWEGDRLTVHDTTQMLYQERWTLAGIFGIPEDDIRILSPYVGGGFGGKGLWSHQVLAIAAARMAGRPVRHALSREGVFRLAGGRTTTRQRVALGAKPDGTLAALIHTGIAAMTEHNNCPEQFTFPARHLYAADSILLEQRVTDMDMLSNTFMRAPGESIGTFALETTLDELAETMQLDPIELRRRLEPAKDPTSGHEFSSRNLLEAYTMGAERFGWSVRNPVPRSRREGEWLIGLGMATATYPYYRMPGAAARITLTKDGLATVATAAHEMGMGTATVQAQAAADRLGLPVDAVTFDYGDTKLPASSVAGGSSQTVSIAAAVLAAYTKLVPELLKLAGNDSPLAGLSADQVESRDAGLGHRDDPARHETYASILARAKQDQVEAEADAPPPLEVMAYSMHSYGAQFAEVRVNAVTGETRVSRFLGCFDAGRILNPRMARSQFRGGIIMGIGLALTEETVIDERTGRIMNPSLAEYHVPVHLDVPEIEILWTDIPDPHAPLGAHGIGEIGITGVGAAIANAIHNATGKRVRDLPITLDKLL